MSLSPRVTNWVTVKSPTSSLRWAFFLMTSSLISVICSGGMPTSMRTYLRERYRRSMWSFMRKLLPLKVRATS